MKIVLEPLVGQDSTYSLYLRDEWGFLDFIAGNGMLVETFFKGPILLGLASVSILSSILLSTNHPKLMGNN